MRWRKSCSPLHHGWTCDGGGSDEGENEREEVKEKKNENEGGKHPQ